MDAKNSGGSYVVGFVSGMASAVPQSNQIERAFRRWSAEPSRFRTVPLDDSLLALPHESPRTVAADSKEYNVEVPFLENTDKHIHVSISVDDGFLPASFSPLNDSFIRKK